MLLKFSQIVNRLYAFIYETNHSKSGLGLPFIVALDVTRGHGDDGGGDDRPPTHHIPTGCGGCFANRCKGTRKPNLGGRKAGRLHTHQETQNLGLKKITNDKGPVPIRFEWDDKKTMMPLGDHASHWSNYLGELIREMPLYYPSWQKVLAKCKAMILTKIRIGKPSLPFGMIPGTKPDPLKIAKTGQRARSYADRDPSHLLAFEIRWSDNKFSQMLDQFKSSPECGGSSESGGCRDDEPGGDDDGDEDEKDDDS
nr:hypothetical protein [Tanacetum cinerariifolium]